MLRAAVVGSVVSVLFLAGCDASTQVEDQVEDGAFVEDEAGIRRTLLIEDVALVATKAWSDTAQRKLFKNATEFDAFFGRGSARATGIDFRRQWVLLFSAGRQNTGGFSARVNRIEVSTTGKTLYPFATFRSPGPGCNVTMALTKVFHLVSLSRSRVVPSSLRWSVEQPVRYCSCEELSCDANSVCIESEGEALCAGRTSCMTARCTADTYCDDSSGLARCLPRTSCAATLCAPGTYCTEASGTAVCEGYSTCANVRCGFGTRCYEEPVTDCEEGLTCPPTRPQCR